MCAVFVIAALLGWYLDRTQLHNDYEARIAKTEASLRVHGEGRLTSFYINPHDEERTLYDIVDQRDARAATVMKLLSVYDCRNDINDDTLVNIFARHAMERLDCDSTTELQAFVREFGFDLALILDTEHPEHAKFNRFVERAMVPPY